MSRLTVCAANRCPMCAVAHPTYGGVACEKCMEQAPNNLALSVFARDYNALELESCRLDCPPQYRNAEDCPCTDYSCSELTLSNLIVPACVDDCSQPDWSCLGYVKSPALRPGTEPLHLHTRIKNVVGAPVPERRVWVCGFAGDLCSTPLLGPITTRNDAFVDITVPRLLAGANAPAAFSALRVEWDPTGSMGPSSALLPFDPPIIRNPSWTLRRVIGREDAQGAVMGLGMPPVDWQTNGGIIFSIATCNGLPAAGITASLDPVSGAAAERAFYAAPSNLTIDSQLTQTSSAGVGAFIDVKPQDRKLTLNLGDQLVGQYAVPVVAGTITVLALAPAERRAP